MKKVLFACISVSLLAISCSKSDDPTPAGGEKYMSTTAGSTWNYQFTDNITPANSNNYTVTSSSRDTVASSKTFHVFDNSNGNSEYYNITASDYYTLQAFSLGTTDTALVNLYLKDGAAVNDNWLQSYTLDAGGVPVQVNVTNKIQEKGITKIVGTTTYTNVIHVVSTISSPTIASLPGSSLTTNINYYYAPKYGMIQNDAKIDLVVPLLTLDQHTDTQTKLLSATIL
ncbi:MAG: hypothetical protein ABI741_16225 [Ferruginibacter sp.]